MRSIRWMSLLLLVPLAAHAQCGINGTCIQNGVTILGSGGGGNTTSTSLTPGVLPKATAPNSIVNSLFSDNGTLGTYAGTGGFNLAHDGYSVGGDTGLWRLAPGDFGLGNGTAGTTNGTLQLYNLISSGSITANVLGVNGDTTLVGATNLEDEMDSDGNPGTTGQCWISQGAGTVPIWTTCGSGVTTVNSNTGALVMSTGATCNYSSGTTTCTFSGSGSGFPITLGSTSIAASSTTTSISGLTLVAPSLGTPTALTLTNATGLPWTGLTGTPSTTQVPVQSLTTTGTSGVATLSGGVLNIPDYAGATPGGTLGEYQVNGGSTTFSGAPEIDADVMSGANCGAKINAALSSIGANPGKVLISPSCGSISTAVTLGTNQHLFVKPGAYSQSAVITVGQNASVECDAASDAPGASYGSCQFTQANSSNLAEMFLLSGTNAALVDVSAYGNGSNNTTAGPNIEITGLRTRLSYVTSQGSHGYGIYLGNGSSNVAAAAKLEHVMVLSNGTGGVYCDQTSDLSISGQSEIENNTGIGITLTDCGGARIVGNDISGNTADGIAIGGIATGAVSAFNNQIDANFFSQNGQNDIEIQGWDSSGATYSSLYNSVTANIFQGSQNHGNGVYDGVKIEDSGYNIITGNVLQDLFGSTYKFKAGVEVIQDSGLFEEADTISGNSIVTLGTPIIAVSSTIQGTNNLNNSPGPVTGALNLSPTIQSTTVTGYGSGSGASQGEFVLNWDNPTTATSGQNYNCPNIGDLGTYWTGSASAQFGVVQYCYFGTGSEPAATYQFAATGTTPSGGLTYLFVGGPVSAPELVSTVSTGTAPLTVNSTTQVGNLNSSFLLGDTWASPGTIGNGTANAGTFTTLTVAGTGPGSTSWQANTGSIPGLPSNSAGFAAPTSGGTSYVVKFPATITNGYLHTASPATGDGVNESALTVIGTGANLSGGINTYGDYGAGTWIGGTRALYNGHFTNIQAVNVSGGSCTTGPVINVIDRTASTIGAGVTGPTTGSSSGNIADQTSPNLSFSAGDDIGIEVQTTGSACGAYFAASAEYEYTP